MVLFVQKICQEIGHPELQALEFYPNWCWSDPDFF